MLKPQDIMVLLKIVAVGKENWAYNSLASSLKMSASEVHAACKRALLAGLAFNTNGKILINIRNIEEFIVHGLKYVFPPVRGELVRGMPTAHAASPLSDKLTGDNEPPPVWPDPEGDLRGMAFSPLYKSAPGAARQDNNLYQMLALVDAIRGGRAREKALAIELIKEKLERYESITKP